MCPLAVESTEETDRLKNESVLHLNDLVQIYSHMIVPE